jgi:hypothetical protein
LSETPPNISEFNTIAGLIFAQLYREFPLARDIDRPGIAKSMGVDAADWPNHTLPSGRSLNDVMANTIGWLSAEGYTSHYGAHPASRVVLTTRGLAALNAKPSELGGPVGEELKRVTEPDSVNLRAIGDLIGGIFGGFTKSLGSG